MNSYNNRRVHQQSYSGSNGMLGPYRENRNPNSSAQYHQSNPNYITPYPNPAGQFFQNFHMGRPNSASLHFNYYNDAPLPNYPPNQQPYSKRTRFEPSHKVNNGWPNFQQNWQHHGEHFDSQVRKTPREGKAVWTSFSKSSNNRHCGRPNYNKKREQKTEVKLAIPDGISVSDLQKDMWQFMASFCTSQTATMNQIKVRFTISKEDALKNLEFLESLNLVRRVTESTDKWQALESTGSSGIPTNEVKSSTELYSRNFEADVSEILHQIRHSSASNQMEGQLLENYVASSKYSDTQNCEMKRSDFKRESEDCRNVLLAGCLGQISTSETINNGTQLSAMNNSHSHDRNNTAFTFASLPGLGRGRVLRQEQLTTLPGTSEIPGYSADRVIDVTENGMTISIPQKLGENMGNANELGKLGLPNQENAIQREISIELLPGLCPISERDPATQKPDDVIIESETCEDIIETDGDIADDNMGLKFVVKSESDDGSMSTENSVKLNLSSKTESENLLQMPTDNSVSKPMQCEGNGGTIVISNTSIKTFEPVLANVSKCTVTSLQVAAQNNCADDVVFKKPSLPPTPKQILGIEPKHSQPQREISNSMVHSSSEDFHSLPSSFNNLFVGSTNQMGWNASLPRSQSFDGSTNERRNPFAVALGLPQESVFYSDSEENCNSAGLNGESFAALNKNPISALMEFAQARKTEAQIECTGMKGPSHKPKFSFAVKLGNRLFPSAVSTNKKDARKEAADIALRILMAEGSYQAMDTSHALQIDRLGPGATHFDRVAALAHQKFNILAASVPDSMVGKKVLAAIVMTTGPNDHGTVVSIGTGNRCITGTFLSLEGQTVNDSHAEVIARRGLVRYLYDCLLNYQCEREDYPPIIEPVALSKSSVKFKVKDNVKFHLYISTAPCGDGALFSPRDGTGDLTANDRCDQPHEPTFSNKVQGKLRTKVEGGEGTIPIEDDGAQSWDGILRGERLRTMSCSDKICRWNVLGLQGALLTHFLLPVYLDSLTLGLLYDHGHLSRAVCCRLAHSTHDLNLADVLPHSYKLNHPRLGRVTVYDPPREVQKTKELSVNWAKCDTELELTDGSRGICISKKNGETSRVSKSHLFSLFRESCERFGYTDLLAAQPTYNEAKLAAKDYRESRELMLKKFRVEGLGRWVGKPAEEQMFTWILE